MTEKELHRLSKSELLELMLAVRKEYDELKKENDELKEKLADKEALLSRLDSIEKKVAALVGGV
ncbi:hypothetical protein [uncultured Ruminococcus sp.]|uniref:hypothetical protein n=1 Tax=uncultured Ruminococcus sp. TaxID=165186 RepID=UPI0025F32017|nr:hypothetical protein [uncultured Ruminococcus sp.]